MFAWQFSRAQYTAQSHGWTRFVSMQNHYNLVYREEEREMIPLCLDQGVGLIPWSPMARGFFAGDRERGGGGATARAKSDPFAKQLYFREEDFAVAERVAEVASGRGVTGSQVALAWMLNKPHITSPIIGATKMDHLEQAIAALDIQLSDEEIKRSRNPTSLTRFWDTPDIKLLIVTSKPARRLFIGTISVKPSKTEFEVG
jgi:1-deoxyxylulose-5-phosphate synthase